MSVGCRCEMTRLWDVVSVGLPCLWDVVTPVAPVTLPTEVGVTCWPGWRCSRRLQDTLA